MHVCHLNWTQVSGVSTVACDSSESRMSTCRCGAALKAPNRGNLCKDAVVVEPNKNPPPVDVIIPEIAMFFDYLWSWLVHIFVYPSQVRSPQMMEIPQKNGNHVMHYNWPWLTKPFSYLITLKNREHHVKCKTIFPHRNGYYTLELVSPLITLLNIDSNPPIGSGVRGKQHFWNRETFSLASFRTLPCGNNQFYVVYNRHMFDGFQYLCSRSTRRVSIYVFPLLSKLVHIWAPFHKDSSKLGVFFDASWHLQNTGTWTWVECFNGSLQWSFWQQVLPGNISYSLQGNMYFVSVYCIFRQVGDFTYSQLPIRFGLLAGRSRQA